jgi:hypothetical protein
MPRSLVAIWLFWAVKANLVSRMVGLLWLLLLRGLLLRN